jgi:hypothetical protein
VLWVQTGYIIYKTQTGHIVYILEEVGNEEFRYSFHVLGILEQWTPYAANFKKV